MRIKLLVFLLFSCTCLAQEIKQNLINSFEDIDSLSVYCNNQKKLDDLIVLAENYIKANPNDSLRLELIKIRIDFHQRNYQYKRTEPLIKELIQSKSEYFKNIGYTRKALFFLNTGNTKFAFENFLKAYNFAKIKNNKKEIAIILNGLGNLYSMDLKEEKAIQYYLQAYNQLPIKNYFSEKNLLLNNLTSTYAIINDYKKSKYYHQKHQELLENNPDNEIIKFTYHYNSANFNAKINKKSAAKESLKIIKTLSFKANNTYQKGLYYKTYSHINLIEKKLNSALTNIDSALYYFKKGSSDLYILNTQISKIKILKELNKFKEAFEVLEEYKELKKKSDDLYVDAYIQEAELKYNDINQKLIITKFKLKNEKQEKQKENFLYIFIIFTIIIIFATIILFFNNKEINTQKDIINSKIQTNTFLTILRTEDRERKRISNELHDIVGAKMAVLKLMIENILDEQQPNKECQRHISGFIDKIIDEIRQISHNLLPQNIHDNGLDNSILELVRDFNNQTKIHIDYFSSGIDDEIDEYYALFIYRIAQEFIGNILKHSKATECILNIYKVKNKIHITIEDNGIGFDIDKEYKGQGIREIQNYIKNVNGKFEIESSPNSGTIINIIFNLTNTTNST